MSDQGVAQDNKYDRKHDIAQANTKPNPSDGEQGAADASPPLQPQAPVHGQSDADAGSVDTLTRLGRIIHGRKGGDPDTSYVARLFHKGDDAILKKIGEEATEVVMAAKDVRHGADAKGLVGEVADLWFHSLIALAQFDLTPADVIAELERREGLSGIDEKALRKVREREQGGH
jgi:phosphoribosyl-ATP pyrophosphohydrolase